MKKVSVIVIAVFAVAFAGYAEAAKPKKRTRNQNRVGPYGAALLGNSVYSKDQSLSEQVVLDVFAGASSPTRNIGVKSEDSDISYQLAFGYRFTRHLAAELSLAQYGEATSIARGEINQGAGFVPASVKLSFATGGPMLSAIGILPINDKFEFYGRAGVLFASAERELLVRVNGRNSGFSTAKGDSTEVVFGAGFAWHINQVYSIRLEHQRLTDVGDESRTGLEDINYTALGMTVRF
jgi:opacity protein-like surface antigen